jgi:hypothetical protein
MSRGGFEDAVCGIATKCTVAKHRGTKDRGGRAAADRLTFMIDTRTGEAPRELVLLTFT